MAAKLQVIDPVAQVEVGEQNHCHRHEQHGHPPLRHAEGTLREPHHQPQPQAEQQTAHPGMVEVLREVGAQIGERSARHHQLLLEKQWRVEKQVQFLYTLQIVAFRRHHDHKRSHERQHAHACSCWLQPLGQATAFLRCSRRLLRLAHRSLISVILSLTFHFCLSDHFFSRLYSFLVSRMNEPCCGPVTPLMSWGLRKLRRFSSASQMR